MNSFTYCLKQNWPLVLVSVLFGMAGILLAILEPRFGDEIFVKIYGKKIYLIFVQISTTVFTGIQKPIPSYPEAEIFTFGTPTS